MKKLLIIALMLAVASCAKQAPELEATGFSTYESTSIVTKPVKKVVKKVPVKQVDATFEYINNDNTYQNAVKQSLKKKIVEKSEISELFLKIKAEQKTVESLQPETPIIEPVEELKPLNPELEFSEKLYNATIKPIRKQVLKWNIFINKQVPKYMKSLKNEPSVWVILISLFAAFIYGILHTLGPGHGKMVIATYFLTQQASIWQGIWLGLQTAFAHVGGAVVLVLVTDIALRSMVLDPAKHMYLLKNISFALIVLVGFVMLTQAVLHALGKAKSGCATCGHKVNKNPTKRETFIALSIGCIPCTGSLLILLYAMANDILILGLLMVIFVAFGMALTMILIGILAMFGKKKLLDKYFAESKHSHKYSIILETTGAIFIILIGILLLSVNL